MKTRIIIATCLLAVAPAAWAAGDKVEAAQPAATPTAPVTAEEAGNDKADLEMAAQIRRTVVDRKDLSTRAKNVQIIVRQGVVTLSGDVTSEAEKKAIETIAVDTAGRTKVTNRLKIAAH